MKKLSYLLPFALLFFACGKDDSSKPAQDRTALLTAKTWKMTALAVQGQNVWSLYPACEKDNTYKFNTDQTFVLTDAGEVCNPTMDASGTWSFNPDKTILTIATPADTIVATIVSMSANEAKISATEEFNGQQMQAVTTFTAL